MPRLNAPEDRCLDFERIPTIYFRATFERPEGGRLPIYRSLGRVSVEFARLVRDAILVGVTEAQTSRRLGMEYVPGKQANKLALENGLEEILKRLDLLSVRRAAPTFADLFAAHEIAASQAEQPLKEKSIVGAHSSMRTILKRVFERVEVDEMRVTVLAGQAGENVARDYRAGMIAERREDWEELCLERGGPPDMELLQEMMDACRRTIKSTLGQARSIFAPEHRQHAAMRALDLPDVELFRELVIRGSTIKQYDPLPESVRDRILADLPALRQERPEVWQAFTLLVEGGLRRSSAEAARWDWFTVPASGDVELNVRIAKRKGYRLPIPRATYDDLRQLARGEYVVPGDAKERAALFTELVQWLRARGVDRNKPNYELRKWFGWQSEKVLGFEQAWKRLGHADERSARAYMKPEASQSLRIVA